MRYTYTPFYIQANKFLLSGKTVKALILAVVLLCTQNIAVFAQTIYYVNSATGSDSNPGTTWGGAFRNVTRAVAAANSSTAPEVDIWIAAGIYTPIDGISVLPADPRDTSFTFYRGAGVGAALKVYGGFRGTETSVSARDTLHPTYLDGIIGTQNSFHIIVVAGLSASADSLVLDGLTIQNGIAQGTSAKNYNGYPLSQNSGGGIVLENNASAKLSIRNCKFLSNGSVGANEMCTWVPGASAYGGGAYMQGSCGYFNKCLFYGNYATGGNGGCSSAFTYTTYYSGNAYGGAMYADSSLLYFNNCTCDSNIITGGNGTLTYYSDAYGGNTWGGGICIYNCNPSITNCNFLKNMANSGSGAGASNSSGGAISLTNAVAVIAGCTLSNNGNGTVYGEPLYGAAIACQSSSPGITNCVFNNNAGCYGGGIYNNNSNGFITGCTFNTNNGSYYGSGYGGGILNSTSSPLISGCTFNHNNGDNGGGIENQNSSNPTISGCIFNYNSANNGGGVSNESASAPVITNCTFTGNTAGTDGGGAYNNGTAAIFTSSSFSSDTAGTGGAIYNTSCYTYIDSCNFSYNIANSNSLGSGGAIFQNDSLLRPAHCIFVSNSCISPYYSVVYSVVNEGGAIYITGSNAKLTILNNIFVSNSAPANSGGAISMSMSSSSPDTLIGNLFIGNKAGYGGGAVKLDGSRHFVYNNTIYKDSSTYYTGGILFTGSGGNYRIANNIFYGNSSDTGNSSTSGAFFYANNLWGTTNPLFKTPANPIGTDGIWGTADDGLRLQQCSPGINTGSNAYVGTGETMDLGGDPRILYGIVDIGAYENYIVAPISGADSVCIGSTVTLTDTALSGLWSSSNTAIATAGSVTGIVRGVSAGTATISYAKSYGCVTGAATYVITVERAPSIITGVNAVCQGDSITLVDTATGGVWSSSNLSLATAESSGVIRGISSGTAIISYSLTNACGTSVKTFSMTVQRTAAEIAGADTLCTGAHTTFTDSTTGGVWSSLSTAVASISGSGLLTAASQGIAPIVYAVANACGSTADTAYVTIQRPPSAITGTDIICLPGASAFTDSAINGTWSSSDTAIASVDTTGMVMAVSQGTATITYLLSNVCGTSYKTFNINIEQAVTPLTGTAEICAGTTTTLSEAAYGGAWTSSATAVASVTGGVVGGLAQGTATITYYQSNVCGDTIATFEMTIDRPVSVVAGADSLCAGMSTTFIDSAVSGSWSSGSPAIATADAASGLVTGISQGVASISYEVSNACGFTVAVKPIIIETLAMPISGADSVCEGDSTSLAEITTGGVWEISNPTIATVSNGVVSAISPGFVTVSYSVSNSCGVSSDTLTVYVLSTGLCDSLTGVNNIGTQNDIYIFPNPAYNDINIRAPYTVSASLLDVEGKTIMELKNATHINMANIPNGIYFIILYDENGNKVKTDKVVKLGA